MIIIGDELIPFEDISNVSLVSHISQTKPNSTLLFDYDIKLLKYCSEQKLPFATKIKSIKEAIYVNSLSGKYVICDIKLAKEIQSIAENYMFDTRVLCIIDSSEQIEEVALKHIDGVIFKGLL